MARARSTDPSTSHDAAFEAESRGRAAGQRLICLAQVKREPGLTAAEIAARTAQERHVPSRRLPELRDQGLVRNGMERICAETGRRSMTWEPVNMEGA